MKSDNRRGGLLLRLAAVLALASIACAEDADPAAEYAKKWQALAQKTAKEHVALAKHCWSRKLHEVALAENKRAAELDPTNADAQKGIGRKLENGAWVDDPKAALKKKNEGSDADIERAKAEYDKKLKAASTKIVKDFEALADWAAKAKLDEQAKETWRRLLDYDAEHAKARAALGYEKQDGRWVPPEDVAKRNEGKKKVAGADEGEEVKEESEIEKDLGLKLIKRRSKHFYFQGVFTEAEMKELIKTAEGSRAAFLETFELDDEQCSEPVDGLYLKTKEEHIRFIDSAPGMDEAKRKSYRDTGGFMTYSPRFTEAFQGGGDFHYMKDVCCHDVIHQCFSMWAGVDANAWLDEGLCYWFTDRLLKSAETHCIEFSLTGGGAGKSWDNVLDWKGLIKEMLAEKANPDIREVMEGHLNSLNAKKGCKAWSLVDYMLTKRKKEFYEFIRLLQRDVKQEEAVRQAFGVKGYEELDQKWIEFVEESY